MNNLDVLPTHDWLRILTNANRVVLNMQQIQVHNFINSTVFLKQGPISKRSAKYFS